MTSHLIAFVFLMEQGERMYWEEVLRVRGGRVGNLNPANLMGLISIFVMERWRLKWPEKREYVRLYDSPGESDQEFTKALNSRVTF